MLPNSSNRMLTRANGQQVSYPTDRTIVQLFEAQAAGAACSRPALTRGAATMTYQELDRHASGLAGLLSGHGVAKGDLVPLIMDGGLTLPVAMIAAMKLGAPFIPMDEAWPRERTRAIIDELRPVLILTSGPAGTWSGLAAPTLRVDLGQLPALAAADLGPPATVDDLVYGFFTSGSTGTPKCTLNRHLGLLNRFLYMTERFGGGGDVVLQNSRHVFDSSIWQLLWPLTNGSQVVIPERDGILDLARTIDCIAQHGVTMTDFVPSILSTLVEMLTADPSLIPRLASLRQILVGGEEVSPKAAYTLRALLPHVSVTNTYGPTEASIGSVFHEITDADRHSVPIGRPIDNTYAAILNGRSELAPQGEVGEIYIGGDCLGAGYLGDPGKTAAAFVENPFPEIPGSLLYRTGDRGFQREDGLFMFAGRTDQQVKLGGVRIELSEVEAVLAAHPAVREAKVIVHGDGEARTLVGFVVAGGDVTPAVLRDYARHLLPGYCVPRRIMLLDRMPLTQNGKVDRHELSRMARRSDGAGPTAARSGTMSSGERAVREVWLGLLPRDDVGTAESFFDSGGDSLSAQRLALALEDRFGVRLTVRDVVATPTISDQASFIFRGSMASAPDARGVAAALRRDVRLDPDIARDDGGAAPPELGRVLLTGATGFIGVHLLHELVTWADATVHCAVRAGSAREARDRLIAALDRHALEAPPVMRRVVAVPCDLALPRLGLTPAEFADLAGSVDTIIHNGALVNLILAYASHRPANVAGTAEILRLAARGAPKRLHYVSTLGVFPVPAPGEAAGPPGAPVAGEHEPWEWSVPPDGYSQSKWVAEKLLVLARARGIPSTVYRLGEVMPHSRTGIANARSVLDGLLRACARLGLRFTSGAVTDWTPVDRVSRFIVGVARARAADSYLHLLRPPGIAIDDIVSALETGTPLREVPYPEFWAAVDLAVRQDGDRELASLLNVLPDPRGEALPERLAGMFTDAAALFSADRAACVAGDLGIPWPTVDEAAVRAWVRRRPASHHRDRRA